MNPDDKIVYFEKESDLDELVITKGTDFEKKTKHLLFFVLLALVI